MRGSPHARIVGGVPLGSGCPLVFARGLFASIAWLAGELCTGSFGFAMIEICSDLQENSAPKCREFVRRSLSLCRLANRTVHGGKSSDGWGLPLYEIHANDLSPWREFAHIIFNNSA